MQETYVIGPNTSLISLPTRKTSMLERETRRGRRGDEGEMGNHVGKKDEEREMRDHGEVINDLH